MKRILFSALIIIVFHHLGNAQVNDFAKKPDPAFFKEVSSSGWVKIKDGIVIDPREIFTRFKKSFSLPDGYSMNIGRIKKDNLGFLHYRFTQQYQQKEIAGGEYLIHVSPSGEITGNGKLYSPSKATSQISINESAALNNALKKINAKQYKWENNYFEQKLKRKKKDPAATYFPKAALLFVYDAPANTLRLCYQFYILAVDAENSFCIYIDAATGAVIKKVPLTCTCDAGTFISNWYGQKTVYTYNNNPYQLEDNCTQSVYQTNDAATAFNDVFTDDDNNWDGDRKRSAATSLWGIKTTRDWYATVFGRNGHGNSGEDLDIYHGYVFSNNNANNASYSFDPTGDDEIRIGTGSTSLVTDDWNTIDITGHEFTHGVDQYEGALEYAKESGALDESFADIFGEYIEYKTLDSNNWGVGWHRMVNNVNSPIRSFINPSSYNDPNSFSGQYWYDVNGTEGTDNWGVHTNSGVQNQMFYLLTVGDTGWNNSQTCHAAANDGYYWQVTGIGIENSILIAYRVLTQYMGNNSGYVDARNAWVHAAVDIFGPCSFEAIQTGKAWNAVRLGPPGYADGIMCGNYGSTAFNYVSTGQVFIAPNCTTNILTTGNTVNVTAGSRIVINPGFSAYEGSRFTTYLNGDCIFAAY